MTPPLAIDQVAFGVFETAVLLRILLAALAGGIIGMEREKHGRPAGLRTHLLVSVGSCLMMVISEAFYLKYGHLRMEDVVRVDPSRVAAQIVTGIGFLGAGVIIKDGLSVRGLTTAASLWVVAGLGMAFGMGLLVPALIGTAVVMFSLLVLKKLEPIIRKDRYLRLFVTADSRRDIFPELQEIFALMKVRISNLETELDLPAAEVRYGFTLTQHTKPVGRELIRRIAVLEGIKTIRHD
jgi:putative Mg2+ transporter-C (MgtC) family protein